MLACPVLAKRSISIHALRKESDNCRIQSLGGVWISIHALRKESDRAIGCSWYGLVYFNPRSP